MCLIFCFISHSMITIQQIPIKFIMKNKLIHSIFNRENLLAFVLALILIALVIVTADNAPTWIYQGF